MSPARRNVIACLTAVVCWLTAFAASPAAGLPARLVPAAPFPRILAQAPTVEFVAPGVHEGDYELQTVDGPLSIHVVAANLRRSDVHVGSLLSHNQLISSGEPVAEMADGAGAVAGINADYFDIDNTNAPENVLVQDGKLLHMPAKRYAVIISNRGEVEFGRLSFTGSVQIATNPQVPLDAINVFPPPGDGMSLITPEFGPLPATANVTLVRLTPLDGALPSARFRVDAIADSGSENGAATYLAIGTRAYETVGTPDVGDVVGVSADLDPFGLATTAAAVGGGPMVLQGGKIFDDPTGPAGAPNNERIPASAIAYASDGTLYLIEVDGRQPERSIGVTRPQLAAIMLALGACEGMALDGGGSSTLVAREPGDRDASVRNSPSDGHPRPVADGLFVFSDAPHGAASRLAVLPEKLRALPGAQLKVRVAVTDSSGAPANPPGELIERIEPAALGNIVDGTFTAGRSGAGTLYVRSGTLSGSAPISVVDRPAQLTIAPARNALLEGERATFSLRASDADGFAIALPGNVSWSATSGAISADGTFVAGHDDAVITARAGDIAVSRHILVGQHEVPLELARVGFSSAPKGQPGSAVAEAGCPQCVRLTYDFTGEERAAYANLDLDLPAGAIGIAFDVEGGGDGTLLRVSAINTIDERAFMPATKLDFAGKRRVVVRFPVELAAAKRLEAIYVLSGIGQNRARTSGSVVISNFHVLMPGKGSASSEP